MVRGWAIEAENNVVTAAARSNILLVEESAVQLSKVEEREEDGNTVIEVEILDKMKQGWVSLERE